MGGKPPRGRGGHLRREDARRRGGKTPAWAGRTPASGSGTRSRPENPRVGGEDRLPSIIDPDASGKPPRGRGGRRQAEHRRRRFRKTPAWAGRTASRRSSTPTRAENPRVGGEDNRSSRSGADGVGKPPRGRGGPYPPTRVSDPQRKTPAWAGRTEGRRSPEIRGRENPRVGGEDVCGNGHGQLAIGKPPRGRGGRHEDHPHRRARRKTPAWAGRTGLAGGVTSDRGENPRVGGEDHLQPVVIDGKRGKPPRGRGGREGARRGELAPRKTPAWAGEDHALPGEGRADHGKPPRGRGGQPAGTRVPRRRWKTPAWAGRTFRSSLTPTGRGENPRVGGEDRVRTFQSSPDGGKPPRGRGGLLAGARPTDGGGKTPAWAGRTASRPRTAGAPRENPRVGGEDRVPIYRLLIRRGKPPRGRGGLGPITLCVVEKRKTPAWAGRT